MPARLIVGALVFFTVASVIGAVLALFGPASAFRLLGAVALGFGVAGCALELYALHAFAPEAYAALRDRIAGFGGRMTQPADALAAVRAS